MVSGCSPLGSDSGGSFVLWKGGSRDNLTCSEEGQCNQTGGRATKRTHSREIKGLMHRRLVLVGSAEDDCCLMGQPRSEGIM